MNPYRRLFGAVMLLLGIAARLPAQAGPPAGYRPHDTLRDADRPFAAVHDRAVVDGCARAARMIQEWVRNAEQPGDPVAASALAQALHEFARLLGDRKLVALLDRSGWPAPATLSAWPAPREPLVGVPLPASAARTGSDRAAMVAVRTQHAAASRLLASRQALQDWLVDFAALQDKFLQRAFPYSRHVRQLRRERANLAALWRAYQLDDAARLGQEGARLALTTAERVALGATGASYRAPWLGSALGQWQYEVATFTGWDRDASDLQDNVAAAFLSSCARAVAEGFFEGDAEVLRRFHGNDRYLGTEIPHESSGRELALAEAARGRGKQAVATLERLRRQWQVRGDGAVEAYLLTADLARVRMLAGDAAGAADEWRHVRDQQQAVADSLPKSVTLATRGLRRIVADAWDSLAFGDSLAASGAANEAALVFEAGLAEHVAGVGRLRLLLGGSGVASQGELEDRIQRLLACPGQVGNERLFELVTGFRGMAEARIRLLEAVAAAGDQALVNQVQYVLLHDRARNLADARGIDRRWAGEVREPAAEEPWFVDESLVARLMALPSVQAELEPHRLAATQAMLGPKEGLVMTIGHRTLAAGQSTRIADLLAAERHIAFVVVPGAPLRRFDLGSDRALQFGCEALRDRLAPPRNSARGRSADDTGLAAATGAIASLQETLRPVFDALPPDLETLWLAADGALASVPWEVMMPEAGRSQMPAVRWIDGPPAMAPRSIGSTTRLLAFGNVAFDDLPRDAAPTGYIAGLDRVIGLDPATRWTPLAGAARERDAVVRCFRDVHPDAESWVCDGAEATAGYLFGLLPKVRYAHFATHGFVADEPLWGVTGGPVGDESRNLAALRSVRSGIVLAGANRQQDAGGRSSIVTAAELATLDLRGCELVVLSACDTSVGARAFGHGLAGLNAALIAAGVHHSITTLWQIDDIGTERFFGAFYDRLWRRGEPLPMAFSGAKRDRREAQDPPAIWAAFVLTSNGR